MIIQNITVLDDNYQAKSLRNIVIWGDISELKMGHYHSTWFYLPFINILK
jgi:hypothetical protein